MSVNRGIGGRGMEKTDIGSVSDGYHTFDELYYHRMILFAVICKHNRLAWKSNKHDDGTMFEDYFIVGIKTPKGQYSYHYHIKYWDLFKTIILDKAPVWDGHKPEDVDRLLSLD